MTNTTARIRKEGKDFEIIVDLEKALKYRRGESKDIDFLEVDQIFTNAKKGDRVPNTELEKAFGTSELYAVVDRIVKHGDILLTQEYRDEEREKKFKQVIDFLVVNAIEPSSGRPHTPERIKSALEQANVNIKNAPIEEQIMEIIDKISAIIPIKVQVKKIKITIPSIHTGKAYGLITKYKDKENWLANGDLEVVLHIPAGSVMGFYDKLNSITHGSALSEEIKED